MCYRDDSRSRNLYQKLSPKRVTTIVRFDWWAAFESFRYRTLQRRAVFYSVQVSGTSFSSVCHPLLVAVVCSIVYSDEKYCNNS